MRAIPTLLTTTPEEFVSQMSLFQKYYTRIQLDIADGKLVPNTTTPIESMISLAQKDSAIIDSTVLFDFHLMVQDYKAELDKISILQGLGMKVNLCLINAIHQPDLRALRDLYGFAMGIDISPQTQLSALSFHKDLNDASGIQVMTVSPGFQGSPFLPEMLLKIEQLRLDGYRGEIMIDGGVNEKTIPVIVSKKYQPDLICIGSYLTKAGDDFLRRVQDLDALQKTTKSLS